MEKRESFIFYASFYNAINELDDQVQLKMYQAICEYQFFNIESKNLKNIEKSIFTLIKFIIDKYSILTNKKIRTSPAYKLWREEVLKRDEHKCQKCGQTEKLNAHHIIRFSENQEERFNVDNGITLCEKCHKEIHKKRGKNGR